MTAWNEELLRRSRDASFETEGIRTGKVFNASRRVVGVAAGANTDSIFLVGSLPVVFFQRDIGRTGSGISATIYQAPVYTGGTPAAVYNVNTNSSVVSSISLLAAPTITSTGIQIAASAFAVGNTTGSGQGGIASIGQALYMKPGTAYLLRVTNLDSGTADFTSFISWYEGAL